MIHGISFRYYVVLLDKDETEIATRGADTMKDAKRIAKDMLSDEYATSAETTHENWGTAKVEIRDDGNYCLWDDFR